jgi:hypothetical protein
MAKIHTDKTPTDKLPMRQVLLDQVHRDKIPTRQVLLGRARPDKVRGGNPNLGGTLIRLEPAATDVLQPAATIFSYVGTT